MEQTENSISERIKLIIREFGVSVTKFAESIGTSQSALHYAVNGRTPSAEMLQKILTVYPDIDAAWLITGIGTMIKSEIIKQVGNTFAGNNNTGHSLQFNGKTVKENNISINDCFDLVAEKERIVSELDAALKSKDIIIADGSIALKEKDAVIKEKNEYIKKITAESFLRNEKKDDQINKLLEQLAEKDTHISKLIDKLK